ncbi:PIG-P-domain-containing protein [Pilatotrama ljubarskyi]|nr:PIG-P-domain-containing protein [Pilatotrama ljubarskyi]
MSLDSESLVSAQMEQPQAESRRGSTIASTGDALRPNDEPTSPTSPLALYPPLLPTESRSRAPEFYGFVAWASTYLLFVLYLLWAFLPDRYILALGVSWYPNREWSLLIPAYGMVLVLLTYVAYFALALAGTPSFSDMRTITDSKAHLPDAATADARGAAFAPYLAYARPDAIPEMYDLPLGLVNRVVYGPRRQRPAGAAAVRVRVADRLADQEEKDHGRLGTGREEPSPFESTPWADRAGR